MSEAISAAGDNEGGLVKISIALADENVDEETLWALHIDGGIYEVRNIPFLARGINFYDRVRCEPRADRFPLALGVTQASGHRTLRVIFTEDGAGDPRQAEVISCLNSMHAFIERRDVRFVAVDVEPQADYDAVFDFLQGREDDGSLSFEEAWR